MSEPDNENSDHGEVVARPGLRISWAWVFPILAALAAGWLFWIDQPVIGLGRTSGIESLIQGNSLNARMGSGPPAFHFTGSEVVPLTQIEEPGLVLSLRSVAAPFLDRGSPARRRASADIATSQAAVVARNR